MLATSKQNVDAGSAAKCVAALDWPAVRVELDRRGFAVLPGLLPPDACGDVAGWFGQDALFRSTVEMARHGFGEGRYRYFADPLPPLVAALRRALYRQLAPLARVWARRLWLEQDYPDELDDFLALCRAAGQARPTPLLLAYEAGGYNRLHQDLYGAVFFPFQVAILLDRPEEDFTGGAFLLVEQQPRRQSRGEAVPLAQGDGVIFATRFRPLAGKRGDSRVALRHGVATLRSGRRRTLGIIFHDAA